MIKDGNRILIRPLEKEDWGQVSRWFYSNKYPEFFLDINRAMKIEDFHAYADMHNGECYLIMSNGETGHEPGYPVGMVIVYDRRWKANTAKLGILIDEEFQNQMYCVEATYLMMDYLFNQQKLRKLIIETIVTNNKLKRLAELGRFKEEATLVGEAILNGDVIDVKRFYIMRKEAKKIIEIFGGNLCQYQQPQPHPSSQPEKAQPQKQLLPVEPSQPAQG